MIPKIRKGIIIMCMGIIGLTLGLASKDISMILKIPITIICIWLILMGIVIETPKVQDMMAETEVDISKNNFSYS